MRISFTKMQALGNDFMVVPDQGTPPPGAEVIQRLADRRTGVGFDQLLWLEQPSDDSADTSYRIFNADGSEVEQCGNGARCIARLLAGPDADTDRTWVLEHDGGTISARMRSDGDVALEMGIPEFDPARVPFQAAEPDSSYVVEAGGGGVELRVVSLGNPHAVIQVQDVACAPVSELGPELETHSRFPNRANIGFMQVTDTGNIKLRVWERGAGETRACGTGACAAAVIGHQMGKLANDVFVQMPGGSLRVRWQGSGTPVWLIGEAVTVFEGAVEI